MVTVVSWQFLIFVVGTSSVSHGTWQVPGNARCAFIGGDCKSILAYSMRIPRSTVSTISLRHRKFTLRRLPADRADPALTLI
jgi:hypothetical protein